MVTPPDEEKSNTFLKIAFLLLVVLIILGGGGSLVAYLLTRSSAPASSGTIPVLLPTLTISSDYQVGSTPAGAVGTMLHLSGQQFVAHSAITILLDEQPAPDTEMAQSDADGDVEADLTITPDWSPGKHLLKARDTGGHTTSAGATVVIVPQGEANTPGPNGAPPDDQSFTLNLTIQQEDAVTGKQLSPLTESLSIAGQPDPNGGVVCQSRDDGQPHQLSGTTSKGLSYQETITWQCRGTYKSGMLTYTEIATSDKLVLAGGATCVANAPYTFQDLRGAFTSASSSAGTFSADSVTLACNQGIGDIVFNHKEGTWTGTL